MGLDFKKIDRIAEQYLAGYIRTQSGQPISGENKSILLNAVKQALYVKAVYKQHDPSIDQYKETMLARYSGKFNEASKNDDARGMASWYVSRRNFSTSISVYQGLRNKSDQQIIQGIVNNFNEGGFMYINPIDRTKYPNDIISRGYNPEVQERLTGNRGSIQKLSAMDLNKSEKKNQSSANKFLISP